MRKLSSLLPAIVAFVVLCAAHGYAQDREYYEARKYITRVFNDSYIISSNNAKVKTRLEFTSCNINYSMTIEGMTERQSCSVKHLDPKRIDGSSGMINIWTINDERRVKVSSLNKKYWALSLSYNSDKYPEKKVISSLSTVIRNCK